METKGFNIQQNAILNMEKGKQVLIWKESEKYPERLS
jgi:hypothetical protein